MIFGNLKHSGQSSAYPPPVVKVLELLKAKDYGYLPAGIYEIEGRDLYIQVIDTKTDIIENKKPEVHRDYVDVQYSPFGNERIGYAYDHGGYEVREDKLSEKDILYYTNVDHETFLHMEAGSFAVFFPWDIHRPNCAVEAPAEIRKVVVKVHLSLFDQA